MRVSLLTFDSASGSFPCLGLGSRKDFREHPANILFLKIQRERVVRGEKGPGIRMVQKAGGGGPPKSLKAEAAKTSDSADHKVKVLDLSR